MSQGTKLSLSQPAMGTVTGRTQAQDQSHVHFGLPNTHLQQMLAASHGDGAAHRITNLVFTTEINGHSFIKSILIHNL